MTRSFSDRLLRADDVAAIRRFLTHIEEAFDATDLDAAVAVR